MCINKSDRGQQGCSGVFDRYEIRLSRITTC